MSLYQNEEEGLIYIWNTERQYDKRGQVMAAVKIPEKNMIVFWDDSRKIDGCFPAKRGNTCKQTMAAYDNGCHRDVCFANKVEAQAMRQLEKVTKDFNLKMATVPLEIEDVDTGTDNQEDQAADA